MANVCRILRDLLCLMRRWNLCRLERSLLLSVYVYAPSAMFTGWFYQAMEHAWQSYKRYAWGDDELLPVARRGYNRDFGGVGLTIIDALDTLYIMGMIDEFEECKAYVKDELDFNKVRIVKLMVCLSSLERVCIGLRGNHTASRWAAECL